MADQTPSLPSTPIKKKAAAKPRAKKAAAKATAAASSPAQLTVAAKKRASSSSSSSPAKQTPKRRVRPQVPDTPADEAAASAGQAVVGYMFCTNGDVQEIRSQSRRLDHAVHELFKPKLADLRKDNAPIGRISLQYIPMPDRWLLVIDEEGAFQQPFNYGIGSFVGDMAAQWYGRLLLVRTTTDQGETLQALDALPTRPESEEDGEEYGVWLDAVAAKLAPFRRAYRQYTLSTQQNMQAVAALGIPVIYVGM